MCFMRLFIVLLILFPVTSYAVEDTDMAYLGFSFQSVSLSDSPFVINGTYAGDPSYGLGGGFSAALGYYLPGTNFRVEGEYSFRTNSVTVASGSTVVDGDWWSHTGMFNLYYDFPSDFISPYIGAGVGLSDAGSKARTAEKAYQFMVGASLNNRFYAGYRYFAISDPLFEVGSVRLDTDYKAHIFELGYRITFGGSDPLREEKLVYDEEREPYEYMPDRMVHGSSKEIKTTYDNYVGEANYNDDMGGMKAQAIPQSYGMAKAASMKTSVFFVQAAVFSQEDNAKKAKYVLSELGTVNSKPFTANGKQYYKINLGPYSDISNAQYALRNVVQMGYKDAFVVK